MGIRLDFPEKIIFVFLARSKDGMKRIALVFDQTGKIFFFLFFFPPLFSPSSSTSSMKPNGVCMCIFRGNKGQTNVDLKNTHTHTTEQLSMYTESGSIGYTLHRYTHSNSHSFPKYEMLHRLFTKDSEEQRKRGQGQ